MTDNPDTLLRQIEESIIVWQDTPIDDANDPSFLAAQKVISRFQDLNTWLTTGGAPPKMWDHAPKLDDGTSLRPDMDRDAFITPKPGRLTLVIDGKKLGSFPNIGQAIDGAVREMAAMEYWPYLWVMSESGGAPRLVEIDEHLQQPGTQWWWASREDRRDFGFDPIEPLPAGTVQAMQRQANEQNAAMGWQQARLMRRVTVSTA